MPVTLFMVGSRSVFGVAFDGVVVCFGVEVWMVLEVFVHALFSLRAVVVVHGGDHFLMKSRLTWSDSVYKAVYTSAIGTTYINPSRVKWLYGSSSLSIDMMRRVAVTA